MRTARITRGNAASAAESALEELVPQTLHQPEDVFYVGSDDENDGSRSQRRQRYAQCREACLRNGFRAPFILSARLQGPFDSGSWQNPWRSRSELPARESRRVTKQRATTVTNRKVTKQAKKTANANRRGKPCPTQSPHSRQSITVIISDSERSPSQESPSALVSPTHVLPRPKTRLPTMQFDPPVREEFWTSNDGQTRRTSLKRSLSTNDDWLKRPNSSKRRKQLSSQESLDNSPSRALAGNRCGPAFNRSGRSTILRRQSSLPSPTHFSWDDENDIDGSRFIDELSLDSEPAHASVHSSIRKARFVDLMPSPQSRSESDASTPSVLSSPPTASNEVLLVTGDAAGTVTPEQPSPPVASYVSDEVSTRPVAVEEFETQQDSSFCYRAKPRREAQEDSEHNSEQIVQAQALEGSPQHVVPESTVPEDAHIEHDASEELVTDNDAIEYTEVFDGPVDYADVFDPSSEEEIVAKGEDVVPNHAAMGPGEKAAPVLFYVAKALVSDIDAGSQARCDLDGTPEPELEPAFDSTIAILGDKVLPVSDFDADGTTILPVDTTTDMPDRLSQLKAELENAISQSKSGSPSVVAEPAELEVAGCELGTPMTPRESSPLSPAITVNTPKWLTRFDNSVLHQDLDDSTDTSDDISTPSLSREGSSGVEQASQDDGEEWSTKTDVKTPPRLATQDQSPWAGVSAPVPSTPTVTQPCISVSHPTGSSHLSMHPQLSDTTDEGTLATGGETAPTADVQSPWVQSTIEVAIMAENRPVAIDPSGDIASPLSPLDELNIAEIPNPTLPCLTRKDGRDEAVPHSNSNQARPSTPEENKQSSLPTPDYTSSSKPFQRFLSESPQLQRSPWKGARVAGGWLPGIQGILKSKRRNPWAESPRPKKRVRFASLTGEMAEDKAGEDEVDADRSSLQDSDQESSDEDCGASDYDDYIEAGLPRHGAAAKVERAKKVAATVVAASAPQLAAAPSRIRAASPPPLMRITPESLPSEVENFKEHFARVREKTSHEALQRPGMMMRQKSQQQQQYIHRSEEEEEENSQGSTPSGSPAIGAMAAKFIEADRVFTAAAASSKTTAVVAGSNTYANATKNLPVRPVRVPHEGPVDDVSAVIKNLDEFLGWDLDRELDQVKSAAAHREKGIGAHDDEGDLEMGFGNPWLS